jgi:hypothetical protein
MIALKPILTDGKSIETPGIIVSKNLGGDYDGDALQVHVPIGAKASEEAKKMLPSGSMLKTGYDTVLNKPDMDMVVGSWLMSKGKGGELTKFKYDTLDDARKDFKAHKITYADSVIVNGVKAPLGMHEINSVVPDDAKKYDIVLNSATIDNWIKDVTLKHSG